MYAIISDIHGNYDALSTVFKDIEEHNIDDVICLGDIVGYGPEPEKCIDLIEKRCRCVIRGNHDHALIKGPVGFSFLAHEAIKCIEKRMKPHLFSFTKKKRWKFIKNLPYGMEEGETLYVHASPREPLNEYIFGDNTFMFSPESLEENFSLIEKYCFVGHTHHPVIILDDFKCIYPYGEKFEYEIPKDRKSIVNIGSVGQPRDRDNRSSYVIVDEAKVIYRRISYDITAVIEKIEAISCIDNRCGTRLLEGK